MRGDESAYAALGLRPGASRAHVDDAYRRLIKIHHPDRNGGDTSRAAEINRAYTMLRRDLPAAPIFRSVPVPVRPLRRPQARRPFWLVVLALAVGVGALAAQDNRPARLVGGFYGPDLGRTVRPATDALLGNFDEPLHTGVIDSAIRSAVQFHSDGDEAGAVAYSRDCHNRLRQEPNLALFDACAAFDESTVTLGGGTLFADSGPFNGSAVMAREMASARTISDDMLGADSRLHQIRSRVEMVLLPHLDQAAGEPRP